jgi:hypothetical protein
VAPPWLPPRAVGRPAPAWPSPAAHTTSTDTSSLTSGTTARSAGYLAYREAPHATVAGSYGRVQPMAGCHQVWHHGEFGGLREEFDRTLATIERLAGGDGSASPTSGAAAAPAGQHERSLRYAHELLDEMREALGRLDAVAASGGAGSPLERASLRREQTALRDEYEQCQGRLRMVRLLYYPDSPGESDIIPSEQESPREPSRSATPAALSPSQHPPAPDHSSAGSSSVLPPPAQGPETTAAAADNSLMASQGTHLASSSPTPAAVHHHLAAGVMGSPSEMQGSNSLGSDRAVETHDDHTMTDVASTQAPTVGMATLLPSVDGTTSAAAQRGVALLLPKHLWVADEVAKHCADCGSAFGLTSRKHHCRTCGHIFCWVCSDAEFLVASSTSEGRLERVCNQCQAALHAELATRVVQAAKAEIARASAAEDARAQEEAARVQVQARKLAASAAVERKAKVALQVATAREQAACTAAFLVGGHPVPKFNGIYTRVPCAPDMTDGDGKREEVCSTVLEPEPEPELVKAGVGGVCPEAGHALSPGGGGTDGAGELTGTWLLRETADMSDFLTAAGMGWAKRKVASSLVGALVGRSRQQLRFVTRSDKPPSDFGSGSTVYLYMVNSGPTDTVGTERIFAMDSESVMAHPFLGDIKVCTSWRSEGAPGGAEPELGRALVMELHRESDGLRGVMHRAVRRDQDGSLLMVMTTWLLNAPEAKMEQFYTLEARLEGEGHTAAVDTDTAADLAADAQSEKELEEMMRESLTKESLTRCGSVLLARNGGGDGDASSGSLREKPASVGEEAATLQWPRYINCSGAQLFREVVLNRWRLCTEILTPDSESHVTSGGDQHLEGVDGCWIEDGNLHSVPSSSVAMLDDGAVPIGQQEWQLARIVSSAVGERDITDLTLTVSPLTDTDLNEIHATMARGARRQAQELQALLVLGHPTQAFNGVYEQRGTQAGFDRPPGHEGDDVFPHYANRSGLHLFFAEGVWRLGAQCRWFSRMTPGAARQPDLTGPIPEAEEAVHSGFIQQQPWAERGCVPTGQQEWLWTPAESAEPLLQLSVIALLTPADAAAATVAAEQQSSQPISPWPVHAVTKADQGWVMDSAASRCAGGGW